MGSRLFNKISKDFIGFRARVLRNCHQREDGCWEWIGTKSKNRTGDFYGRMTVRLWGKNPSKVQAHRVAYMAFSEQDIPDGYDIDHLCVLTLCVNPGCLKPKPAAVNRARRTR